MFKFRCSKCGNIWQEEVTNTNEAEVLLDAQEASSDNVLESMCQDCRTSQQVV